jgi:hypothetical protein
MKGFLQILAGATAFTSVFAAPLAADKAIATRDVNTIQAERAELAQLVRV